LEAGFTGPQSPGFVPKIAETFRHLAALSFLFTSIKSVSRQPAFIVNRAFRSIKTIFPGAIL
jgi:hypothetical protein